MEMRRLSTALILGLIAALAAVVLVPMVAARSTQPVALAQAPGPAKGITVSGTGRVSVRPDVATVRVGVQTQAENAQQAQQANAQKMDAVVRTLKELGIPEKDIRTSSISLRPVYEARRDGSRERIVGYEASNTVTVRVTDLSKVGNVLDEVVKAGANVAGGIQFGLQDDSELRREALRKAVQDGEGKAEAIAGAMGRSLGPVESVVEESVSSPQPLDRMMPTAAAPEVTTPVEPGELQVTATIRVVYGF
ncbi:MAG: SIMPL domain-containing protein [Chloroflexi bacterium]|nr:SIMPL domain-containing protein [Chloroflexota bacterium]